MVKENSVIKKSGNIVESQYFSSHSIVDVLCRYRHLLLIFISHRPRLLFPLVNLYIALAHKRGKKPDITTRRTDIVIEGFPRSANTFALTAFNIVQKHHYIVAHHIHASAQVIQASKLHIPALVLIRTPKDAIVSYMVRHPYLTPNDLLREYIHFYNSLLSYRHSFTVATFEQVINSFDTVIEKVNKQFETNFELFNHSEENLKQCFDMIEELYKGFTSNGTIDKNAVSLPSTSRKELQKEAVELYEQTASQKLLEQADKIYEQFKSFT